jgi:hypothetical protein
MARPATPAQEQPLTRAECGERGVMARLMTEDWASMTAAANKSARHVSRLDRWIAKAREANPGLSDDQAERLGLMLRKQHYIRMGKLSGQARKLAREAKAELDAAPAI